MRDSGFGEYLNKSHPCHSVELSRHSSSSQMDPSRTYSFVIDPDYLSARELYYSVAVERCYSVDIDLCCVERDLEDWD